MIPRRIAGHFVFIISLVAPGIGAPVVARQSNRFDPVAILERMDRNRDGRLMKEEVPEEAREFVQQIARECGVDPAGSLNLKQLREAWSQRNAQPEPSTADSPTAAGKTFPPGVAEVVYAYHLINNYDANQDGLLQPQEWKPLGSKWAERDLNQDNALSTIEVAIGLLRLKLDQREGRQCGGTSELLGAIALLSLKSDLSPGEVHDLQARVTRRPSQDSDDERPDKETLRLFAENLIKLYDTDGDGQLQPKEWERIGDRWAEVDFDRNGRITLDEMMVRFLALQQNRIAGSRETRGDQRRARLPADLPERFLELDENRDGQVQMHEFSAEWDEQLIRQFRRYDSNRDGVITPTEWLLSELEQVK